MRMFSGVLMLSLCLAGTTLGQTAEYGISIKGKEIVISAGMLNRTVTFDGGIRTTGLFVSEDELLSALSREFAVTFTHASPNQRPVGLRPGEGSAVEQKAGESGGTDSLQISGEYSDKQEVEWVNPLTVAGDSLGDHFRIINRRVSSRQPGVKTINIRARSLSGPLAGVSIDLHYEVYEGHPVIRKWIEIANNGTDWLKIEGLIIDDITLAAEYFNRILLTPEERGACSSIIAFGNEDQSRGILAVSEIPSALRAIHESGSMGYADEHFEWVLGPSERFVSEPVFQYAFDGETYRTLSGVSTAMDRTVEGSFQRFLEQHVGLAADTKSIPAPLWCSWSNFGPMVNDANMREQANLASRAGFACLQIDAGWNRSRTKANWDCAGSEPDSDKFPNFDATSRYIRNRNLDLGIWVSCFRSPDSHDRRAMPDAHSLPEIKRGEGIGMSFASNWREFYANDLAYLHDRYGVTYVKQDLSNIKFGDIAEGHESRTKKESLLRGLRGLLDSQDVARRLAPDVKLEITHEIYWGTPGVPCDVAVLKHAHSYHIPPNDYSGCGHNKQRPNDGWTYDSDKLSQDLIRGCWNARQRFYAHRGLPLYCLEYYAAATVNFKGSLTPEIQDRQVCSWLMGAPSVFAGDLASLTPKNISHYRKRFDMIRRLQRQYDIYRFFQYSGVPAPTETDWHWWGKLNEQGCGIVVVIRGDGGLDERRVNIPWVKTSRKYRVEGLLSGKSLGVFIGRELHEGSLKLSLPVYGQEILEVSATD